MRINRFPHEWSPSGARCVRCNLVGTGDTEGDGPCERHPAYDRDTHDSGEWWTNAVRVPAIPSDMTQADVLRECVNAQALTREVSDECARVIATFWQSPGPVGHVLAAFGSGMPVATSDLLDDIHATRMHTSGVSPADTLELDMLATWAIRKGDDDDE